MNNNLKRRFTKREIMTAGVIAVVASCSIFGLSSMDTSATLPPEITKVVEAKNRPNIVIMIDGKPSVQTTDRGMAYITLNTNRVMIPTRIVAEDMGFKVDWDQTTKKVTVSNGTNTIVLTLNSKYVTVNGVQKTLDAATEFKNNRVYIPVRAVSEALGAQVEWIGGDAQLVNITTGATEGGTTTVPSTPQTPSTTVTYANMVPGKQYPISEVISNVKDKATILDLITEDSAKGDVETIKIVKGNTITGINYETGKPLNIKVDTVGWASDMKMSLALKVSNLEADTLRIYYLQNGKIIGHDLARESMKITLHGKNYYVFGDGLAETPQRIEKATHLAIAAAYTGEMIIIENPNQTPILNIYAK